MTERIKKLIQEYEAARKAARDLIADKESTTETRTAALNAAEAAKLALDTAFEEDRRAKALADPPSIDDKADQEAREQEGLRRERQERSGIRWAPSGAPDASEERAQSRRNNSYRPFGWVRSLPAYSQERAVLERAGQDLRDQADAERLALERYVRVPNLQAYLSNMDAEMTRSHSLISIPAGNQELLKGLGLEAITEVLSGTLGVFTPVGFIATPISDPGAPSSALRPFLDVQSVSTDTGFRVGLGSVAMAFRAEGATGAESDPAQLKINYDVNTLRDWTDISSEQLQDEGYDTVGNLSMKYGEAYNRSINQYVASGTGASQPNGLRTVLTGAMQRSTLATAATLVRADLRDAFYKLPAQWRVGAAWNAASEFYAKVAGFEDTDNKGSVRDDPTGRILGKPTIQWDGTGWEAFGTSDNDLGVIGDFGQYMWFERMGLAMMRDDYARADEFETRFRFAARVDGQVAIPGSATVKGAFVLIDDK